jgi:hypothetical protein
MRLKSAKIRKKLLIIKNISEGCRLNSLHPRGQQKMADEYYEKQLNALKLY